jgi:hypothetical protein
MKSVKDQLMEVAQLIGSYKNGWAIVGVSLVIVVVIIMLVVNRPEPVPPPDPPSAESQALKRQQRKAEFEIETDRICKHLRNKPMSEMTINDMQQLDACKAAGR